MRLRNLRGKPSAPARVTGPPTLQTSP